MSLQRSPRRAATEHTTTVHRVSVRYDVPKGFEVASVRGLFDLPESKIAGEDFDVELPADTDWQIGAIVGPSGSGKSTVAREVYGDRFLEQFEWDPA